MNRGIDRANRRSLLAAAAAGVAGSLAAGATLPGRGEANDHDPIKAGETNTAQSTTLLQGTLNGRLLSVANGDGGPTAIAIAATTNASTVHPGGSHAVFARNGRNGGWGVTGEATGDDGIAVVASATGANGTGANVSGAAGIEVRTNDLAAFNPIPGLGVRSRGSLAGVFGEVPPGAQDGPGVWGNHAQAVDVGAVSGARAGVLGTGSAVGVAGVAGPNLAQLKAVFGAVGVFANADGTNSAALVTMGTNYALWAKGSVAFSTVRQGAFKAGQRVVNVPGLPVGMNTGVVATLNQPAGAGVYLAYAHLDPAKGKAVVVLNKKATRKAAFTLFVFDRAV